MHASTQLSSKTSGTRDWRKRIVWSRQGKGSTVTARIGTFAKGTSGRPKSISIHPSPVVGPAIVETPKTGLTGWTRVRSTMPWRARHGTDGSSTR